MVGVVADLRGQVESDAQAGLPLCEVRAKEALDALALECPEYVRMIHGRSRPDWRVFSVIVARAVCVEWSTVIARIQRRS